MKSCVKWQKNLGIIDTPKIYQRNSASISLALKEKAKDFYCRDDISYQAPGKRDSITVKDNGKKLKVQKRYLLYTLNEVYRLFLNENTDDRISCSSFKELRPPNVLYKSLTPHNMCTCLYHENVLLLIQALNAHVHGFGNIELSTFVKLLVCDDTNESCMFTECDQCRDQFRTRVIDQIIDTTKVITWTLWSKSDTNRIEKLDHTGTVRDCAKCLHDRIEHYLFHVFIKRRQSEYFQNAQANVSDKYCVLQVDYSENFFVVEQNEIQSAHWSRK